MSDRSAALRLRGRPGGLAGALVVPESAPPRLTVHLALGAEQPLAVTAHVVRVGARGLSDLRLDLPRWTPPGTYQGTVTIGQEERRVVVEVEPRQKLRVAPRRLRVVGKPKAVVSAELALSNVGNVPCEVRGAAVFALFDPSVIEIATARAFQAKAGADDRFVDRVAAELTEGYAGTVRLKVDAGAGTIEPGECRDLRLSLHLPEGLRPGHRYEGVWRIATLGYNIEVETESGPVSAGRVA